MSSGSQATVLLTQEELPMVHRALEFYLNCEDVLASQWLGDYDLPKDMILAEHVIRRILEAKHD